ncbi:MAG: SUF system Fe-S cluster assembly regulator [Mariprofundaceae bacterium]|nr:SUF system Fe-S cluster assembly regulator [Mariprofundaceae bacterium]
MLRLTRVTDYGILLMTEMVAKSAPERWTANDLSQATHVPAPTVSKILQSLLRANLLISVRGAQGGYQLARQARDISLQDIIHCLEGRIALTECNLENNDCEQSAFCSTSHHWKRINQSMLEALGNISLADMADEHFMPVFTVKRGMPIQNICEVA